MILIFMSHQYLSDRTDFTAFHSTKVEQFFGHCLGPWVGRFTPPLLVDLVTTDIKMLYHDYHIAL